MNVLNRVAVNTYKGLNTVGRGLKNVIKAPVDDYINKMTEEDHQEMSRNIRMIQNNFGSVDNYLKLQDKKNK